jgi:nicotinamidase/pyrazinamidase
MIFWEVDAQSDFMLPGGKLYVPGAEKIIRNIKRLVDAASSSRTFIVSSACSHSENDPEFQQFPPHCIHGTAGAQIIPEGLTQDFITVPNDGSPLPPGALSHRQVVIEKQVLDVFSNPRAGEIVDRLGSSSEFVVFGVVTEYCVNLAAKGLLARGRKVAIVEDAIETLAADASHRTLGDLTACGARLISTSDAVTLVTKSHAAR